MKRIMSLLITLVLLLSIDVAAFDNQQWKNGQYSEAIEKLLALGIMEGYIESETYEFMPDKEASRVEFYVSLVKAMSKNKDIENNNGDTPFVDLTASHWAAGYINEASKLNILVDKGPYLHPEESISMGDALAILLHVTGYKQYADMKGGAPNGYIRVANEIGITDGVKGSYDSFLTRGQAAQLISNTIDISVLDINSISSENSTYSVLEGCTIVSRGRGLLKSQGRVTENEFTSYNKNSNLDSNFVKIDDEIYNTGSTDISEALGLYVEFYYEEDGNNILYYVVEDRRSAKTLIYDEDILNVSKSKVDYKENNKKKSLSIVNNANVIYNGKYLCKAINLDETLLKPEEGYIELISFENNKIINLIKIHDVETYVAKEIFPQKFLINDFNDKDPLYLNEDVDFVIKKNGKKILFNELIVFDVISVEKSFDSSLYTMTVSDKKIDGVIDMYGDDSVVINEIEYSVNDDVSPKIILGKEGTFYIDCFGKIVAINYSSSTIGSYGYLVQADSPKRKSTGTFEIYTSSAEFVVYTGAEKIYVDGYKMTKGSDVISKLNLSGVDASDEYSSGICQLIRYTLNENEQIVNIDTIQENKNPTESDFKCFAPMATRSSDAKGAFGSSNLSINRFYTNSNTIFFDIPSDKTNQNYYDIKTQNFFVVDTEVNIAGYDATELCMASACVINTGGSESKGNLSESDALLEVVSKKFVARTDDDEFLDVICSVSAGKENRYYISERTKFILVRDDEAIITYDDIRPGDIICIEADSKNYAKYVYKIFPDTGSALIKDIDEYLYSYGSYKEYIFGHIEKKSGSGILVNCENESIYCYLNSSTSYMKFNFEEKKASTASISDLIASPLKDGNSKVFIRIRNGDVKNVIIYE